MARFTFTQIALTMIALFLVPISVSSIHGLVMGMREKSDIARMKELNKQYRDLINTDPNFKINLDGKEVFANDAKGKNYREEYKLIESEITEIIHRNPRCSHLFATYFKTNKVN